MNNIIVCSKCRQKNRVKESNKGLRFFCANCKAKLNRENRITLFDIIGIILFGCLVIFAIIQGPKNNTKTASMHNVKKSTPVQSYPEVPMPPNGTVFSLSKKKRIASFQIKTSGNTNYFVKLVSTDSPENVVTIFIHSGQSVLTKVPLGIYELRYASGQQWYGYEHLFGIKTNYRRAETPLVFKKKDQTRGASIFKRKVGTTIYGNSITLYPVVGGNMKTEDIGSNMF